MPDFLKEWFEDGKKWFFDLYEKFKEWLIEFLSWFFLWSLDQLLSGILWLIEQIPAPDFIEGSSIGSYLSPDILWMLNQSGIDGAMAILASGVLFRTLRRILTLGIW